MNNVEEISNGQWNKVFCIGFNKSGTTSIHKLFEFIGLKSYHGIEWRRCIDLGFFGLYDCFSDGIPKDLEFLDQNFQNSKYILQVRELDTWVYSRLAHIDRSKIKGKFKGNNPEWDTTIHSVKAWIQKRNTHHLYIMKYFAERPSDFLIINFIRDELADTSICRFLGFEGALIKPFYNQNPERVISQCYIDMLELSISELQVPENELNYDIYCPSLVRDKYNLNFPADTSQIISANSSRNSTV